MQVFEFFFNPKARENSVFESFVYEPENISEKRLGSLCVAGEMSNAFPGDKGFLSGLAEVIKEEYYSNFQRSSEAALKESLRKANEHLARLAKAEKINWVGNLNFSVLAIKESNLSPFALNSGIPFILNYAQVGEMKILLLKKGEILDISRDIEARESEIYPLKVFENVIAGRLEPEDRVIVATRDVFSALVPKPGRKKKKEEDDYSLNDFIEARTQKEVNQILKARKNELSEVSGIFIFIVPEGENRPSAFRLKLPLFKIPKLKITLPRILPLIQIPRPSFPIPGIFKKSKETNAENLFSKKNAKIILALFTILALSYLIFGKEEKEEKEEITQEKMEEIREKEAEAEGFLIIKENGKAIDLLQSALEEVKKFPDSENQELSSLKSSLEEKLFSASGMVILEDPELMFEINRESSSLIPKKMIVAGKDFYFYDPASSHVLILKGEENEEEIDLKSNPDLALAVGESVAFYSDQGTLSEYSKEGYEEILLETKENYRFEDAKSFYSGLYFLEENGKQIIKYNLSEKESGIVPAKDWLNQQRIIEAESMAIDGSIWVLNSNNEIEKYYKGNLEKIFSLAVFPSPKNLEEIITFPGSSYLYFLEPESRRVIISGKDGEIFRQYSSEKFDELLDFAVSEDEKAIFLLNGKEVYKIEIL